MADLIERRIGLVRQEETMLRRMMFAAVMAVTMISCCNCASQAEAQDYRVLSPYSNQATNNLQRFYHYPYVTYPHNYWGNEYFRSNGSLYYRYPQEMRVPVYNRGWHNFYPSTRRYHWGHQFLLDVF